MTVCRLLLAVASGLAVAVAGLPGRAALLPRDTPLGPGAVIRDTETGLDWLKTTLTSAFSYNELVAQLGPGGRFEGFSFAGQTPWCDLVGRYVTGAGSFCRILSSDPVVVDRAEMFIALLGPTVTTPDFASVNVNVGSELSGGQFPQVNTLGSYVSVNRQAPTTSYRVIADTETFGFPPDAPDRRLVLVRAPVPEPAPWMLLPTAVAGAIALRRRGPRRPATGVVASRRPVG